MISFCPTIESGIINTFIQFLIIVTIIIIIISRRNQSTLHNIVNDADKRQTQLNLQNEQRQPFETNSTKDGKIATWKRKGTHGRHAYDLSDPDVDKKSVERVTHWRRSFFLRQLDL